MQFQINSQPGVHDIEQSLSIIYKEGQRAKGAETFLKNYRQEWPTRFQHTQHPVTSKPWFKALVFGSVALAQRQTHRPGADESSQKQTRA